MPYPQSQRPTFAELRSVLEDEYGCEFKTHFNILNELQVSYPVRYFKREMAEETLTCVVIFPEDEDERIELSFLRSICVRLRVDPGRFGLTLDYLEED